MPSSNRIDNQGDRSPPTQSPTESPAELPAADRPLRVAGIDGCRAGWIAVRLAVEPATPRRVAFQFALAADRPALETLLAGIDRAFIDIPIGLAETDASRPCDRLLRRALGRGYAASVFSPPTRAAVCAESYRDACDRNAAATGKKISKQAWFIAPKIRQIDELLRDRPDLRDRLLESHPEWLFRQWHGSPLPHKKRVPEGKALRLDLLARSLARVGEPAIGGGEPDDCETGDRASRSFASRNCPTQDRPTRDRPETARRAAAAIADWFGQMRQAFPKKDLADDDCIDALALALAAARSGETGLRSLPDPRDRDRYGLPMAIHFPEEERGEMGKTGGDCGKCRP